MALTHTTSVGKLLANVPDLSGQPHVKNCVFFMPPPAEIGALLHAESTLTADKKAMSSPTRAAIFTAVAFPGIAILLAGFKYQREEAFFFYFLGFGIFSIGVAIVWYFTKFIVHCAYVGELGAVRYTLKGHPAAKPRIDSILFENAAELRTEVNVNYVNGVYARTFYRFHWTAKDGRTVLKLSGCHRGGDGLPKPGDPYLFPHATEMAWSNFLLGRADEELAQHGFLQFNISNRRSVIVGPDFIEFHFDGRKDRCEARDIRSIRFNQGHFTIEHHDAKWYSSKGRFSFAYAQMANAQLFVYALERFLPRSVWSKT